MDLKYRAYMSGWLNNLLLMWRYNVTNPGSLRNESYWFTDGWDYRNSEEGREFPVGVDSITPVSPGVLRTTQKFGDFLQMESGGYLAEYNMTTSPNRDNGPFNISSDQFAKIRKSLPR